jgi:hypothetical protein
MEFTMLKTIKWYLWSLWKRVLLIGIFVIASSLLIYLGSSMGVDKTGGTFLLSLGSAILAIGLVTLVSEFITSTKILKIMRLYGDYAQHGILRIFPSKDDPEYKEIRSTKLKEASHIKIITLIGRAFIESRDKIEVTKQKMKEAVEFKLLVLKPDCPHWEIQYRDFEPPDLDVIGRTQKKEIGDNFEALKAFVHDLKSEKKELRYYDRKPVFQIEIFDQTMFIAFYGLGSRAKDSPVIMFEERSGSLVFQYFAEQFNKYWQRGEIHE